MGDRQAKDALYEALASVGKALGNGRRAELVDVLAQGERCVEELAGEIGQSVANTSQHLQFLLRAGLVRTRRDGPRVRYSLTSEAVGALWRAMREVAHEHVARVDDLAAGYLGDRSHLVTISREELLARMRAGEVVVLDVRPPAEYAAGHLPDAVNVPPDELGARLADLPAGRPVVAYCRGPLCAYADAAVRALAAAGRPALRLVDGLPEWAAAGLPVVRASA
ncbi:metalloregulator ArsR/SmtB family transcription factor [Geodermatophilus sp. YIM 151500]|uniref:ArsR/SmtB family transcription factor n=1 Tax=Geodermatophilus sp. YIM 151500 TaxID=2984531 RepID=UPI0021E387A8|nr:metalloregulator ArsR/SmtB family transcription factor [Geodermatophilus sp. YIM 151500]MCV2488677.1 metalloregulator ArsR/SmtB family transcription factor [Geodermatophilus sp. YIM 151500]